METGPSPRVTPSLTLWNPSAVVMNAPFHKESKDATVMSFNLPNTSPKNSAIVDVRNLLLKPGIDRAMYQAHEEKHHKTGHLGVPPIIELDLIRLGGLGWFITKLFLLACFISV